MSFTPNPNDKVVSKVKPSSSGFTPNPNDKVIKTTTPVNTVAPKTPVTPLTTTPATPTTPVSAPPKIVSPTVKTPSTPSNNEGFWDALTNIVATSPLNSWLTPSTILYKGAKMIYEETKKPSKSLVDTETRTNLNKISEEPYHSPFFPNMTLPEKTEEQKLDAATKFFTPAFDKNPSIEIATNELFFPTKVNVTENKAALEEEGASKAYNFIAATGTTYETDPEYGIPIRNSVPMDDVTLKKIRKDAYNFKQQKIVDFDNGLNVKMEKELRELSLKNKYDIAYGGTAAMGIGSSSVGAGGQSLEELAILDKYKKLKQENLKTIEGQYQAFVTDYVAPPQYDNALLAKDILGIALPLKEKTVENIDANNKLAVANIDNTINIFNNDKNLYNTLVENGNKSQNLYDPNTEEVVSAAINSGQQAADIYNNNLNTVKPLQKITLDGLAYQGLVDQIGVINQTIKSTTAALAEFNGEDVSDLTPEGLKAHDIIGNGIKANLIKLQELKGTMVDWGVKNLAAYSEYQVRQDKVTEFGLKDQTAAVTGSLMEHFGNLPKDIYQITGKVGMTTGEGNKKFYTQPLTTGQKDKSTVPANLVIENLMNQKAYSDIRPQIKQDGVFVNIDKAEAIQLFDKETGKFVGFENMITPTAFFYQAGKTGLESTILGGVGGAIESGVANVGETLIGQTLKNQAASYAAKGGLYRVGDAVISTAITTAKIGNRITSMVLPTGVLYTNQMYTDFRNQGFDPEQSKNLTMLSVFFEGGFEAAFGNEIKLYNALLGKTESAVLKKEAAVIFDKAIGARILEATGRPATIAELSLAKRLVIGTKSWLKNTAAPFAKQGIKVGLEESAEEEGTGLATALIIEPKQKEYNPSYVEKGFSAEDALTTMVTTMATMLPMMGTAGYHHIQHGRVEALQAKFEVGSAPLIHLQNLKNSFDLKQISKEDYEKAVVYVEQYASLKKGIDGAVENAPNLRSFTNTEKENIKLQIFSEQLKKSDIEKQIMVSLTNKQKAALAEQLSAIDDHIANLIENGTYTDIKQRNAAQLFQLDYLFNDKTIPLYNDPIKVGDVMNELEAQQAREIEPKIIAAYDQKINALADRFEEILKERHEAYKKEKGIVDEEVATEEVPQEDITAEEIITPETEEEVAPIVATEEATIEAPLEVMPHEQISNDLDNATLENIEDFEKQIDDLVDPSLTSEELSKKKGELYNKLWDKQSDLSSPETTKENAAAPTEEAPEQTPQDLIPSTRDSKADIEIGKVGNTEYEVKADGIEYKGKKLDNPKNLPHKQLITEDIERRKEEELDARHKQSFDTDEVVNKIPKGLTEKQEKEFIQKEYDKIYAPINAKYKEELDALEVKSTTTTTEDKSDNIKNRNRKDLFPDESEFADVIGGSGQNSKISSYKEVNGIGIAEYTNPKNGLVDVIMTGTSDNDYVGYVRIYTKSIVEGKVVITPSERWTSKMENKSQNKANIKTMLAEVQKLLPAGHEYTEKTNISLEGLKTYAQQLKYGYKILLDKDGKPVVNQIILNKASVSALQNAKSQEEIDDLYSSYENLTRAEYDEIKAKINALMPEARVLPFNEIKGTINIDLPVLKSTKTVEPTTDTKTDIDAKKADIERRRKEELTPFEVSYLENKIKKLDPNDRQTLESLWNLYTYGKYSGNVQIGGIGNIEKKGLITHQKIVEAVYNVFGESFGDKFTEFLESEEDGKTGRHEISNIKEINAKYDAELAALETPKEGSVVGRDVELKENNDVEVEDRKAFDIFYKGKQVGTISLEDKGTHYQVSNAKVSTPNKGIGTEAYKQLISTLDKPLISDKILSQGADALWRKLEREGFAKYNEETKQFETLKTIDQQIVDLRAQEQAEYESMTDPNDEVAKKEIYDRYDKLITPLLKSQEENKAGQTSTVNVEIPKLMTVRVDLSSLNIDELKNVAKQLRQKAVDARQAEKEGKTVLGGSESIENDYQAIKKYIEELSASGAKTTQTTTVDIEKEISTKKEELEKLEKEKQEKLNPLIEEKERIEKEIEELEKDSKGSLIESEELLKVKKQIADLRGETGDIPADKIPEFNILSKKLRFLQLSPAMQIQRAVDDFIEKNNLTDKEKRYLNSLIKASDSFSEVITQLQKLTSLEFVKNDFMNIIDLKNKSIQEIVNNNQNEIDEIANKNSKKAAKELGIEIEKQYSANELDGFVQRHGSKQTKFIWGLIKNIAEKLGVKTRFSLEGKTTVPKGYGGHYAQGKIDNRANLLQNPEQAARVIVHELVHGVTNYIIDAVKKNKLDVLNKLTKKQINAAKKLSNLLRELQSDSNTKDFYGAKNEDEILAELTHDGFVEALQNKKLNFVEKFLDYILDILGIPTTAYDEALSILKDMLENPVNYISEGFVSVNSLYSKNETTKLQELKQKLEELNKKIDEVAKTFDTQIIKKQIELKALNSPFREVISQDRLEEIKDNRVEIEKSNELPEVDETPTPKEEQGEEVENLKNKGLTFKLGKGFTAVWSSKQGKFIYFKRVKKQDVKIDNFRQIIRLANLTSKIRGIAKTWYKDLLNSKQRQGVNTLILEYRNALQTLQGVEDYKTEETFDTIESYLMRAIQGGKLKSIQLEGDVTDVNRKYWFSAKGTDLDEYITHDLLNPDNPNGLIMAGFGDYNATDVQSIITDLIMKYPKGIRDEDIEKENISPFTTLRYIADDFIYEYGISLEDIFYDTDIEELKQLNLDEEIQNNLPGQQETTSDISEAEQIISEAEQVEQVEQVEKLEAKAIEVVNNNNEIEQKRIIIGERNYNPLGSVAPYGNKDQNHFIYLRTQRALFKLRELQAKDPIEFAKKYFATVQKNTDKLLDENSINANLAPEKITNGVIVLITDEKGVPYLFDNDGNISNDGSPIFQNFNSSKRINEDDLKYKTNFLLTGEGLGAQYDSNSLKVKTVREILDNDPTKKITFTIDEITPTENGQKSSEKLIFSTNDLVSGQSQTLSQSTSTTQGKVKSISVQNYTVDVKNSFGVPVKYTARMPKISTISLKQTLQDLLDLTKTEGLDEELQSFSARRELLRSFMFVTHDSEYNKFLQGTKSAPLRYFAVSNNEVRVILRNQNLSLEEWYKSNDYKFLELNENKSFLDKFDFKMYNWDTQTNKFVATKEQSYKDFILSNITFEGKNITQKVSTIKLDRDVSFKPKEQATEQVKPIIPQESPLTEKPKDEGKKDFDALGDGLDDFTNVPLNRLKILPSRKISEKQEKKNTEWFNKYQAITGVSKEDMTNIANDVAYAQWYRGAITLFKGSTSADLYHEAFHDFTQLYLTKKQKIALYNEVANTKEGQKILNTLKKDATDLEKYHALEELMAEDFKNYMLSDQKLILGERPKRNSIFRKIFNFLKELFTNQPSLETIYKNLANNNIKGQRDFSNAMFGTLNSDIKGLDEEQTQDVYRVIDSVIGDKFRKTGLSIAGFFKDENKLRAAYNSVHDSILKTYKELENTPENALSITNSEFLLANWNNVRLSHVQNSPLLRLSKEYFKINEDEFDEEKPEVKGSMYDDDSSRSVREKASAQLIYLIATQPAYLQVGDKQIPKPNAFLPYIQDVEDFNSLWNNVANILNGTLTYEQQYKKLQKEAETNLTFKDLVSSLPNPFQKLDGLTAQLRNQFIIMFSQPLIPMKIMNFRFQADGSLNVTANNATVSSINKIKEDWKYNLQSSKNPYATVNYLGRNELDIDKVLEDFVNIGIRPEETKIAFLNALGISFSPKTLRSEDFKTFLSDKYKLKRLYDSLKEIQTSKNDDTLDFRAREKASQPFYDATISFSSQGDQATLKELADIEVKNGDKYIGDNMLNANGDSTYGIRQYSQQSMMFAYLNDYELYPTYNDLINSPIGAVFDITKNPDADNIFLKALFNFKEGENFGVRYIDKKTNKPVQITLYNHNGLSITSFDELPEPGETTLSLSRFLKAVQDISPLLESGEKENLRYGDKVTANGTLITFKREGVLPALNPHIPVDIKDFKNSYLPEQAYSIFKNRLFTTLKRTNDFFVNGTLQDATAFSTNVNKGDYFGILDGMLSEETKKILSQDIKDKELDISKLLKDNETIIRKDIANYMEELVKDYSKELSKNKLIDPSKFVSTFLLNTHGFDTILKAYIANSYILNMEHISLFFQDIRFYTDKNNYKEPFKRFSKATSTGIRLVNDPQINAFLQGTDEELKHYNAINGTNILERDKSLPKLSAIFNDIGYSENSPELKDLLDMLDKVFKNSSKEDLLNIRKAHIDMKPTDAMAFCTFDFYREVAIKSGNDEWSPEKNSLYKKIATEQKLTEEETKSAFLFFPPLKLRVVGYTQDKEGNVLPLDYKFAISPLLGSIVKGKGYEVIKDNMLRQQVSLGLFNSASKHSSIGVMKDNKLQQNALYNEDNTPNSGDWVLNPIQQDFIFEVVPSPKNYKEEATFSTQLRKLLFVNSFDNGIPIDYKGTKFFKTLTEAEKIKQSYVYYLDNTIANAIDDLVTLEKNTILNKIGATLNTKTDKYTFDDAKLSAFLEEELSKRNISKNALDTLKVIDGKFKYSLDSSLQRESLEQILLSIIDNKLKKQKSIGESLIQASSIGYENFNKAIKIKPEVKELFESNESLANSVYEVLGFKKKNIEEYEDIVDKQTYQYLDRIQQLEDWKTDPQPINVKNLDTYIKKITLGTQKGKYEVNVYENGKEVNKYFNTQEEAINEALEYSNYYTRQNNNILFKSIENRNDYLDKEIKKVLDKANENEDFREYYAEALSSKITPQQKQQALQQYSQYLDSKQADVILPTDRIVFGHPTIGKSFLKNQGENKFISLDDDYATEINNKVKEIADKYNVTTYQVKDGGTQSWNNKYNQMMQEMFNVAKQRAISENKTLFTSNTNLLRNNAKSFDKVINLTDKEFERRIQERGAKYDTKEWKSQINEAISKLPANKVINTDKYLSDLFLGSKQDIEGFKEFVSEPSSKKVMVSSWKNVGGWDLPYYGYEGRTLPDGTKVTSAHKVKIALQGDFKKLLDLKDVKDLAKNPEVIKEAKAKGEGYLPEMVALNRLLKDEKWLDKDNNRRLVSIIGVRIPVQGHNSKEFMEVFEFLPTEAGPIVIVSPALVAKSGGDFDWDKVTSSFPSFEVNKEGKAFIYKKVEGLDNPKNNINNKKALNNIINDAMRKVLERTENIQQLLIPNSTHLLEPLADARKAALNNKKASWSDVASPQESLNQHESNSVGKQSLGILAVANTFFSQLQRAGAYMSKIFRKDLNNPKTRKINHRLSHNKTDNGNISLSSIMDALGLNRISDVFSQLINGAVDVAKKDWIFFINGIKEIIPNIAYLNMTGTPVLENIAFHTQPIINDFIETLKNYKSPLVKYTNRKAYNLAKIHAIYETIAKYADIPQTSTKLVPGQKIISKTDIDRFIEYVNKSNSKPKEFFTSDSKFTEFYQNDLGIQRGIPQSSKWFLNDKGYYDLIDQETGEFLIDNVSLATGIQYNEPAEINQPVSSTSALSHYIRDFKEIYEKVLKDPTMAPLFYGYMNNQMTALADKFMGYFEYEKFKDFAIPVDGKLKVPTTQEEKFAQVLYLVQFLEFESQQSTLSSVRTTMNQDTKKPINLQDSNERLLKQKEAQNHEILPKEVIKKLVTESTTKAFTSPTEGVDAFISKLLDKIFDVTDHPIFNQFLKDEFTKPHTYNPVKQDRQTKQFYLQKGYSNMPFNVRYDLKEAWIKAVKNDFIEYLAKNNLYLPNDPSTRVSDYFFTNLINYNIGIHVTLDTIKDKFPELLNNNLLLQYLEKDPSKIKVNGVPQYMNLKLKTERIEPVVEKVLIEAFKKLINFNDSNYSVDDQVLIRTFAQDLAYLAFNQSGLNSSKISFTKIIPQELYSEDLTNIIRSFKKLMDENPETAIKEFDTFYKLFKKNNSKFFRANDISKLYPQQPENAPAILDINFAKETNRGKNYVTPEAIDLLSKREQALKLIQEKQTQHIKDITAQQVFTSDIAKDNPRNLYVYNSNTDNNNKYQNMSIKVDNNTDYPNTIHIPTYKSFDGNYTDADFSKIKVEIDAQIQNILSYIKQNNPTKVIFPQDILDRLNNAPKIKEYLQQQLNHYFDLSEKTPIFTGKNIQNMPSKLEGQMTYSYGSNKREDITSTTTFDAILNGERTATTRYESDGKLDYWKSAKVGDIIKWESKDGRTVNVVVTKALHPLKGSGKTAEQWSKLEGWSKEYFDNKVRPKLDQAWQIEYKLATPTTELSTQSTTGVKVISADYGIVQAETNPTENKTQEFLDLVKPQIQAQTYKENIGNGANQMFHFGKMWSRVTAKAKPIKNNSFAPTEARNKLIDAGENAKGNSMGISEYTYAYHELDQNGNPLPSLSQLQPIIDEIQRVLGRDMSDYDSVIGNIYQPNEFIFPHKDVTESKSAKGYPVIVYTMGANAGLGIVDNNKGKMTFANQYDSRFLRGNEKLKGYTNEVLTKNGTIYTFGMDGKGRFELTHSTPINDAKVNSQLPITLPNGKVITNYTITLTFRRAADLTPGMPTTPAKLGTQPQPSTSVKNFSKKNLFTVTPQQGVSDNKAKAKASIATQYIGFGEGIIGRDGKRSTTQIYREQVGALANTGNYSANDVIFVSIPGLRGDAEIAKREQNKTIKEAIKALEAGATIITDNKDYIDSSAYNTGEQRLYKNMEDKGYSYSEITVDGQVLGIWENNNKPSIEEEDISQEQPESTNIFDEEVVPNNQLDLFSTQFDALKDFTKERKEEIVNNFKNKHKMSTEEALRDINKGLELDKEAMIQNLKDCY